MTGAFRLPEGGLIDRTRPLRFRFDGRTLQGCHGDTLASALLANGVRVVARSFKFHRPRGIYAAGEEEPCALVETGTGAGREPACRAPMVPLHEGLVARSQSGWPRCEFDLGRVFDLTWKLWPAGFYHKTFKWPRWQTWEGMVRRLTSSSRAPEAPDPDHYEQVNAHCDLLVCGGGPAGLAAALAAARAGARVILAEQQPEFGGSLNAERIAFDGRPASAWVRQVVTELNALPRVLLLPATTATAVYDHNVTTLLQRGSGTAWRECLWTVRPRRILLATGAIEQGMIFPDNDRPGIMLAGAARHYLNRYAVACGRTAVVATNNDSGYQTAMDLADRGIAVAAVVDLRTDVADELKAAMDRLGVPLLGGARIAATRGSRALRAVRIESVDGQPLGDRQCDLLAVSGGWSGRLHLLCHARGSLRFDPGAGCFLPDDVPDGLAVTGSAAGEWDLGQSLTAASATAQAICAGLGLPAAPVATPKVTQAPLGPGVVLQPTPLRRRRRQWIDLAHDVTLADAELAVREGFDAVEHFKRYTTTGMAADQGKTGNLNAWLVLSALTGQPIEAIGTTTFRPPYTPVTLGAVAARRTGAFYAPRRLLPAHRLHESLQARFEDYGGWQRPDHYARSGTRRDEAIRREVVAVREAAGVFDNSPIGKVEVRGPDAAAFLDRFYINDLLHLAVGRCRYGLMLNENGVIIDDGVVGRLADDHFLVNTTSAGVADVVARFEEWHQCEWPRMQVTITDVTSQWATCTVAGPHARQLLAGLAPDIDLAPAALPHMAVAAGRWQRLPVRIARISFSGETSFEINVPARAAGVLLEQVLAAGRPLSAAPYGIEALMILRLEKGYLHVGSDTDGQTSPDDVGWGRVARRKPRDYIGRRSLFRPANEDTQRRQLVGLETHAGETLQPGSHLLLDSGRSAPATTDGWVTSAAWSPTLGGPVALAMVRGGHRRYGETVTVLDDERRCMARVRPTCFFDPDNTRLRS